MGLPNPTGQCSYVFCNIFHNTYNYNNIDTEPVSVCRVRIYQVDRVIFDDIALCLLFEQRSVSMYLSVGVHSYNAA